MTPPVVAGEFEFGAGEPPLLIVGPCVIESADATVRLAESVADMPSARRFRVVFKSSYSKDNRSSSESYRGPGLDAGLAILEKVRRETGLPVLSDVHSAVEAEAAADVLDIVQIPAFLCRQTSLIEAVAPRARTINVKKGQFMAPEDMAHVAHKIERAGGGTPMLTERGSTFGYHDLVVDFRSMPKMRALGCPVIFDVTHSLQKPSGKGSVSGGEPGLAAGMARAAAAVGCDGLFIEVHERPGEALSDGASMVALGRLSEILDGATRVFDALAGQVENSEKRMRETE